MTATELARIIDQESLELRRRAARFRIAQARIDISGRVVVIVDDGIATGSTATAAIRVARDLGAKLVIVAAPVAPHDTIEHLQRIADAVVVLEAPPSFRAVGQVYVDFVPTSDEEVIFDPQPESTEGSRSVSISLTIRTPGEAQRGTRHSSWTLRLSYSPNGEGGAGDNHRALVERFLD